MVNAVFVVLSRVAEVTIMLNYKMDFLVFRLHGLHASILAIKDGENSSVGSV